MPGNVFGLDDPIVGMAFFPPSSGPKFSLTVHSKGISLNSTGSSNNIKLADDGISIKGITYSFPSFDNAGALTSDGSGNLTWGVANTVVTLSATFSLNSTQIESMTSSFTIVEGIPNKVILPISGYVQYNYGTIDFMGGLGSGIVQIYHSELGNALFNTGEILTATTSQFVNFSPSLTTLVPGTSLSTLSAGVDLKIGNLQYAVTGGDGTLTGMVTYQVLDA